VVRDELTADHAPEHPRSATLSRLGLAALLLTAGTAHFLSPQFFDRIVPGWIGHERAVTYASGAAELTVGTLLLVPRSRRVAGYLAAALLVIVWPANFKHTLDHFPPHDAEGYGSIARLPLQLPLIAWALHVARGPRSS
jgi:uncharacterized membrane protein